MRWWTDIDSRFVFLPRFLNVICAVNIPEIWARALSSWRVTLVLLSTKKYRTPHRSQSPVFGNQKRTGFSKTENNRNFARDFTKLRIIKWSMRHNKELLEHMIIYRIALSQWDSEWFQFWDFRPQNDRILVIKRW